LKKGVWRWKPLPELFLVIKRGGKEKGQGLGIFSQLKRGRSRKIEPKKTKFRVLKAFNTPGIQRKLSEERGTHRPSKKGASFGRGEGR